MFKTGDEILKRKTNRVHIMSFHWNGFTPHLIGYSPYQKKHIELPLDRNSTLTSQSGVRPCLTTDHCVEMSNKGRIDIEILPGKRCVGSWHGGEYLPCPNKRPTGWFHMCDECAAPFIPNLNCIFEPECDGEKCGVPFCTKEHAVYLAFHGTTPKIGMTSVMRLEQRLIEQGADAYAVLAKTCNRKKAREEEERLSHSLSIRQRISSVIKLKGLQQDAEPGSIRSAFEELGMDGELMMLDGYPLERLQTAPSVVQIAGHHEGMILGLKGSYLVYENNGPKALNAQDIVGHYVIIEGI